jgi:hypothetical protein
MSQLKELSNFKIAVVTAIETKVPHLFKGAPGSAKTAALADVIRALGGYIESVLCATLTHSDVLGFPYRDSTYSFQDEYGNEVNGALKFSPPYWALKALEAAAAKNPDGSKKYKFVCLFFDELYTATPAVQSALLRPLNEGFVGDLNIQHIIRIAAANGRGQSSGFSISQALENRFSNLNIFPDNRDWLDDFILSTNKTDAIEYTPYDNNYKDVLADMYSQLIETNTIQLVEGDTVPPGAFPSKRSMSALAKVFKFCSANNIRSSFVKEEVTGLIGAKYVNQALAFYESIKNFEYEFDFTSYLGFIMEDGTPIHPVAVYDIIYGEGRSLKELHGITTTSSQELNLLKKDIGLFFLRCSKEKDKGQITKENIRTLIKIFLLLKHLEKYEFFKELLSNHAQTIENLIQVNKSFVVSDVSLTAAEKEKKDRDAKLAKSLSNIKFNTVSVKARQIKTY